MNWKTNVIYYLKGISKKCEYKQCFNNQKVSCRVVYGGNSRKIEIIYNFQTNYLLYIILKMKIKLGYFKTELLEQYLLYILTTKKGQQHYSHYVQC